jgi:uncharacterized protein (DUF488 family)
VLELRQQHRLRLSQTDGRTSRTESTYTVGSVRLDAFSDKPILFTVGVYGFTIESFLAELDRAGVRVVLDVRQRRGVRGTEYAWANSQRLQAALAEARIAYEHHPELAPTTEMRKRQYAEDDRRGIARRARVDLTPEYVRSYTSEILDRADLDSIADALASEGPAALLCVERDPEACHRSLIAARLADGHGLTVAHLLPPG